MSTLRPEAAHRGHHAQKGEEGCVGSFGLGEREEVGSAVGAGRKRRPQAM